MDWWKEFKKEKLNLEQYEALLNEAPVNRLYHVKVLLDAILGMGSEPDMIKVMECCNQVLIKIGQLER